jgi:hypothetical protein
MDKSFEIGKPTSDEGVSHYRDEILTIINDIEIKVRSVVPDELLHQETHEKKHIYARREREQYEEIRQDVCASFGVSYDDEHVYLHDSVEGTQRALRAFYVLIDSINKQAFYGEGRIDHNTLLIKLCDKLAAFDGVSTYESVTRAMDEEPLKYLIFKGFLSKKEFKELSDASRSVLETPIIDGNGHKISTPSTWFVTGHNIPEVK